MWHSRPPRDPPPFMANAILNFHFDFLTTSLRHYMLNKLTDNQMLLDQVMLLLTGGLCQESVVLNAALLSLKPRQGTSSKYQ